MEIFLRNYFFFIFTAEAVELQNNFLICGDIPFINNAIILFENTEKKQILKLTVSIN